MFLELSLNNVTSFLKLYFFPILFGLILQGLLIQYLWNFEAEYITLWSIFLAYSYASACQKTAQAISRRTFVEMVTESSQLWSIQEKVIIAQMFQKMCDLTLSRRLPNTGPIENLYWFMKFFKEHNKNSSKWSSKDAFDVIEKYSKELLSNKIEKYKAWFERQVQIN